MRRQARIAVLALALLLWMPEGSSLWAIPHSNLYYYVECDGMDGWSWWWSGCAFIP